MHVFDGRHAVFMGLLVALHGHFVAAVGVRFEDLHPRIEFSGIGIVLSLELGNADLGACFKLFRLILHLLDGHLAVEFSLFLDLFLRNDLRQLVHLLRQGLHQR